METILDKVSRWFSSNSMWDPFFSAVTLNLLQKYPKSWFLKVKREGHPRTGFVEDKEWTLIAGQFRIQIYKVAGDSYPSIQLYQACYDYICGEKGQIRWSNKCTIQNSGTIARSLGEINSYLKDFRPNEEISWYSTDSPKEIPDIRTVYSEGEILTEIVNSLELTPKFIIELVDRLAELFQFKWIVKTEKVGHPRTGFVEDVTYSLSLYPFKFIIEKSTIKLVGMIKYEPQVFCHDYGQFPRFLTDKFEAIRKLQRYIPKKIYIDEKIRNYNEFVYVVYVQDYESPAWRHHMPFVTKKSAVKSALAAHYRSVVIRCPLMVVIKESPDKKVIEGESIMFVEHSAIDDKYHMIEVDDSGHVVTTTHDWTQHQNYIRDYK